MMPNAKRSLARQKAYLTGRPMPVDEPPDIDGAGDEPMIDEPANEENDAAPEPVSKPASKPASKPKAKGKKKK